MNLSLKIATVPDDYNLATVLRVHSQMQHYLEQNNLIYGFQSGFRSVHSIDISSRSFESKCGRWSMHWNDINISSKSLRHGRLHNPEKN